MVVKMGTQPTGNVPADVLGFFQKETDPASMVAREQAYQKLAVSTLTMCCTCDNN